MDGDEAVMALVGRHILHDGERPIFFPAQAYMGAWQSYLAAGVFWLFGESRPVAKIAPLVSSAAFVATLMLLAARLYGRNAALVAGLFAALPSLYFVSNTVRLWSPMIDVLVIGNVILWLGIDTAYRDHPPRNYMQRVLLLGLLTGFGFWLQPAVAVYALPVGLLLLLRWPRRALLPGLPLAALGFVIGGWPVFQFARTHAYTTFDYLRGNDADVAARDYTEIAQHLARHILPRYLGVAVPWEATPNLLQLAIGLPVTAAIVYFAVHNWRGILAWVRLQPQRSDPACVILLFGATVLAAYILSRFSVYVILQPSIDATGRYVVPLGTFIPLALAGAAHYLAREGDLGKLVATAGAIVVLVATLGAYAASEPHAVFQTPYFRKLPPSNDDLIAALDEMGVDAVWVDHWAGTPLMFDTHERIAAADYVDLRVWNGPDRLPAATMRVFAAEDAAFVFITTAERVPLEQALAARGVPYEVRRVGAYVIVHPHVRVDPSLVEQELLFER
jgi:hypothetical protein